MQDEPPPYKESGSKPEADSDVVGRVDRKDVRYGEQMGKGRFATVYKAEISRSGRKSVIVAAKKLRSLEFNFYLLSMLLLFRVYILSLQNMYSAVSLLYSSPNECVSALISMYDWNRTLLSSVTD